MISRESHISKRKSVEEPVDEIGEITFPLFQPSIRALRVDSKILLVGFPGEHSWPHEEVPLEIMIGESPYTKTKTLNFVIVRSDSPHNLLLGRIAMQKLGIVVYRIHAAIKFYTPYGIGIVSSTYESNKVEKWQKKVKETISEVMKDVLRCLEAKERIIVNDRYPEQTVFIRKTIKVGRKLFNTENKMNEYKHIKPVKQKRRGLGLDHNEATCKEVDKLTKAGIIQKVKDQTERGNKTTVFIRRKGDFNAREKMAFRGLKNLQIVRFEVRKKAGRLFLSTPSINEYNGTNPLSNLAKDLKNLGRIAKWAIELGEHDIEFKGRDSIKRQIPPDFLVETPLAEDNRMKIT
ncbi:hypothetical protein Tco_0517939 [Tanacetum coccineum]